MITIELKQPIPFEPAVLERAALIALEHQSVERGTEVTILVTGDEGIQDLNLEYRGEDSPTDVLSFTALEPDPETGNPYLGDIVISAERAAEQAETAGHPLEAEMQLLVVHGILHLCGHDHSEPEDKARMWAAQAEILGRLGLSGMTISE